MGYVEKHLEHLAATFALEQQLTRSSLEALFQQSIRGNRITGAAYRPLLAGVTYAGSGRLLGVSARETSGQALSVDLYDAGGAGSASEAARLVATFELPAGGSVLLSLPGDGVAIVDGLYAVLTGSGAVLGALWVGL